MNGITRSVGSAAFWILAALGLRSEAPGPSEKPVSLGAPRVETASTAERRTVQQFGLTFVLARSERKDGLDTEEYFLEGEKSESWSQMITYQRLTLAQPLTADGYVQWLKKHFEQTAGGPRLKIVRPGKTGAVFAVQYPTSETSKEQFSLALVMVADPRRPNELHLIQYALNPTRLSLDEMELQVKRWQSRFESQAAALAQ